MTQNRLAFQRSYVFVRSRFRALTRVHFVASQVEELVLENLLQVCTIKLHSGVRQVFLSTL